MKLYVVMKFSWAEGKHEIEAIFVDREAAEEYLDNKGYNRLASYTIEEHTTKD